MRIAALIPARLESTRFPGKLMKLIGKKSIIRHVYDNMVNTGLFGHVAVVCDHQIIYDEITKNGGRAYLSKALHENGTSRIAEVAAELDYPIVFNIQGDEPFVKKEIIQTLISLFENDISEKVDIVSPMTLIEDEDMIANPNVVKVVTRLNGEALYFSRSPIPFRRNMSSPHICHKHIGIYGFRKEALLKITSLPPTPLDDVEMVECIKYLEHGMNIAMALTDSQGVSIDTPEDLEMAIRYYESLII